jgi:hypothetical protein
MTSDPQRLLDGTSSDDSAGLERDLLRSLVDVSPPSHAQGAAWDGIATKLAAASVVAAGTTVAGHTAEAAHAAARGAAAANGAAPPVATGIAQAFATKTVVGMIVAAGAAAAAGGAWVHFGSTPATASSRPAIHSEAPSKVAPLPSVETVTPDVEAPASAEVVTESPPAIRSAPRAHPDDGLAREGALLTDARASLRAGNPTGALAVLRKLDREFPRGGLRQEREVLAIEALSALGDTAAVKRRAEAFVKAYPGSPHGPHLRRLMNLP